MAHLYSFDGRTPRIHPAAYVHPTACVIGDVEIDEGCFVGPQATLRADNGAIRLGPMCNVQDNCVLHCSPGGGVVLHALAQVGHGAVLHGCTLMENSLVGINGTVLDGAVVGANSVVAAHALVTKGSRLDDGALYAGSPAARMRTLPLEAIAALRRSALHYVDTGRRYAARLRPVEPGECLPPVPQAPPNPVPDAGRRCTVVSLGVARG